MRARALVMHIAHMSANIIRPRTTVALMLPGLSAADATDAADAALREIIGP